MSISTENPFTDLMTKAVKLKGAQQAQLRTQFDSWPQYFQHSLFMQDSVRTVRTAPFGKRLDAAEGMKAAGNAHFTADKYNEAVAEYEKALAVFKYLENKDPDWKKKGIEDNDMVITDFKCDNMKEQKRLDGLKVSCYLNIAVAKFKLKEYAVCIRACDDTLEIDPRNVKAYYRRAQALITPASAGAIEFNRAIADLQKAYTIDSKTKEVRKLLRDLMEQRIKQRALDKETFSGMFDRGQVYNDSLVPNQLLDGEAREVRFKHEVEEAEALARGFEAQGKTAYANEIREKITKAREEHNRRFKRVDFFNPTAEMIANAKENGIDLTDRNVQQMLYDLQEEERTKSSSSPKKQCDFKGSHSAVESVDSLLRSMSNAEIAQLLDLEGIDYPTTLGREQLLETARQVLLSKLDIDNVKAPTKTSLTQIVVLLAVLWTLLRLYTSGGLSVLSRSIAHIIRGSTTHSTVDQKIEVMNAFDEY